MHISFTIVKSVYQSGMKSWWINEGSWLQIEFNLENVILGFEDKRKDALNCMVNFD